MAMVRGALYEGGAFDSHALCSTTELHAAAQQAFVASCCCNLHGGCLLASFVVSGGACWLKCGRPTERLQRRIVYCRLANIVAAEKTVVSTRLSKLALFCECLLIFHPGVRLASFPANHC
jgi:hypothetical protein